MNVKRFVAADMRRALELVKMEMGDDAIILSSKRTKAGVEILTSNDAPYEEARSSSQMADTNSNYGAIAQQLSPSTRANLFNKLKSSNTSIPDDVALQSDDAWNWNNLMLNNKAQERGQASGKTKRQLAEEIAIARQKAEAADRVPLGQQEEWLNQFRQQQEQHEQADIRPAQKPVTQQPAVHQQNQIPQQMSVQAASAEGVIADSFIPDRPKPKQVVQERIEPQVPTQVDEAILNHPDERPTPIITEVEKVIPGLHAPFTTVTANYLWNPPQDLSHYLIQPEDNHQVADNEAAERKAALEKAEQERLHFERLHNEQQMQSLMDEISDMREMLHIQLERLNSGDNQEAKTNNTVSLASAIKATIGRRLKQMGFQDSDIEALTKATKVRAGLSETWADVLAMLAHQLPATKQGVVDDGGVFAFVGPSGAGKTVTISKLATKFVLAYPKRKLALVVLEDVDAKQSALVRLGQILDVPVKLVKDRISLTRAIVEYADCDLVLIDTPSHTPGQKYQRQGLSFVEEAFSRLPQVEKILVLPTNAQAKTLRSLVNEYQSHDVKTCVLTKLDESASLGEVMSVILQSQLTMAYFTNGQIIPNDIQSARGYQLVTLAVSLLKKDQYDNRRATLNRNKFQTSQQSLSA